ncbi:MAG: DUF47 family protein [Chromatiaceae bacterium]
MNGHNNSIVTRLKARIFPVMPDFFGMMVEHCDLVVRAMDIFLSFMETGDVAKGHQIRAMEKEGDELKARQMEILNHTFATPMDREDIYRAIMSIDEILNYAKSTISEMEALETQPDAHMVEIARQLRYGTHALKSGYAKLSVKPLDAETNAAAARKAERNTEKLYRAALAELFRADDHIAALRQGAPDAQADAFIHIMTVLKRREIYRHLSNTADRVEQAGGLLHDIIVQIA